MDDHSKETTIRCSQCDMGFESKEKLEQHEADHSAVYCDTCPIDMAIRGIAKIFRRNRHAN